MGIYIDSIVCTADHNCPAIMICPVGAVSQSNIHSVPEIDYTKCTQCGKCTRYCPPGAIKYSRK